MFRKYEGNFYTAIVYSVEQLISNKDIQQQDTVKYSTHQTDTTDIKNDTTSILYLIKK